MADYATLNTEQGTYGVRVPIDGGSCTIHFDNEIEALELICALNKAFMAGYREGWEVCYHSIKPHKRQPTDLLGG